MLTQDQIQHLRRALFGRFDLGVAFNLGLERRLVGVVNAGEMADLSGARFFVESPSRLCFRREPTGLLRRPR